MTTCCLVKERLGVLSARSLRKREGGNLPLRVAVAQWIEHQPWAGSRGFEPLP